MKFLVGQWSVDPASNVVRRRDRQCRLEPRAMDVLVALARRAHEVVSTDELLTRVWHGAVVSDGSVYLAINRLRRALDDSTTKHIETVPKRGYRLTVPVVDTPSVTLALLPFDELTEDRDAAHFARGLAIELGNVLGNVAGLQLVALTASRRLVDHDAVRRLGSDYVLTGSVRKSNDRVRITVQLTDTRRRHRLWSETYERRLDDLFATQDEIATAVADALQITLRVGEIGHIRGMTRNVAAYDEYLKALSLNLEWNIDSSLRAIAHLDRAVAIDPAFSLASSQLRSVCFNAAILAPERAKELRARGSAALERALALTPDAPGVLLEAGIHEADCGKLTAAAEIFARLSHCYTAAGMVDRAFGPRGILLLLVGRAREAVSELERARAHDPLAVAYAYFLSCAYLAASNYAAAAAELSRGRALGGLERHLATAELAVALSVGSAREIERRIACCDEEDRTVRALLAARAGNSLLALELLSAVTRESRRNFLLWTPPFSDVRKLPAFEELAEELGFVDYWRTFGRSELMPAGSSTPRAS